MLSTISGTASNKVTTFAVHNSLSPDSYIVFSTTNLVASAFVTDAAVTGAIADSADQSGVLLSNAYTRKIHRSGVAQGMFPRAGFTAQRFLAARRISCGLRSVCYAACMLWRVTALVLFCFSVSVVRSEAQLLPVYFEVVTATPQSGQPVADSWYGAFDVADLSLAITNTTAVFLTTPFVGGLTQEPGFWFRSGPDFVWQGDLDPPGANSTIPSQEWIDVILAGASWEDLFGNSFALLSNVTTDLSALNPTAQRVSGQGGTIAFSSTPIPEPSTFALLTLAGIGLGLWVRARTRN